MKISATFTRKVGLPGYCSLGASCTVETDTKKTDPGEVAAQIRAAYALATQAVEDQISAQLDLHTAPDPEPDPGPDPPAEPVLERLPRRPVGRDGRPLGRAATAGNGGPDHAGGGYDSDRPTDGRQLLAVVRRWGDEDGHDLMPDLVRWGKREGHPWRVVDWDRDEVAEGYAWLMTRRAEPAGRPANGRAHR